MDAHGKSSSKRFYLTLTLLLGILLFTSALKADQIHDGDVAPRGNPDGQVDVADALVLQRLATGLITPTADEQTHGDIAPICNPDGVIDISDALIGLRVATGQLTIDGTPPAITITSHNSGDTLLDPNVTISGTIDDNSASVYVNGVPAIVGSGTYSADITLGAGPNTVTVDAIDPCQNQSQLQITLNYSTGPTNVSGNISTDTTWTVAEAPYIVGGNLTINNGVTLTIEQGTEIRFEGNYEVIVDGTLLVQGLLGSEVIFTSDNAVPAKGDWRGITINSTSTGSLIDYAIIEYAYRCISVDGANVTVSNSTITNFSNGGIYMTDVTSGIISGNTIDNLAQQNYGIYLSNSSPTITGNTIQNNYYGIYIYIQSDPLVNGGNVITGNKYGLYVYGNNTVGANPNPVVTGNEIYSNTSYDYYAYAFYDASNMVLDASNNWWGTTDAGDIGKNIYDYSNNSTYSPVVDFTPYLDSPSGSPVSGNFLNGPVHTDTTLTSGMVYDVVGDIHVESGATLTIEAGVMLRFSGSPGGLFGESHMLSVDGTLLVQGSLGNEVIFTSVNAVPAKGDWQGIAINSTSTGSVIDYAVIEYAYNGISVDGTDVIISNCMITNFSIKGINMTNAASGTISENTIDNFAQQGYGIYLTDSSPSISGNTIQNDNYGIYIYYNSNPVINGGNVITGNKYGLYVKGWSYGNDPKPVVNGNEIYSNTDYDYYATSFYDASNTVLDASNNWWGTTDAGEIGSKIYDYSENDTYSPFVNFIPFLDAPGGNPVSGNFLYGPISADMTLTSGTVYDVVESIFVEAGVTLTIEAGVTLRFVEDHKLVADGTLLIQGSPGNEVTLTSGRAAPANGDWHGIIINSTSIGSVIEYAVIEYAYRGISVDGAGTTISNSMITNFSDAGIYIQNGASGTISGNTIDNLAQQGYGIYLADSSPAISGNTIQNNKYGIYVYHNSNPLVNGGNVITNNLYGLYMRGSKQAGNDPNPVVTGNEIYSNTDYDYYSYYFYNTSNTVLDASNNWWGTTDAGNIGSKIYDYSDNQNYSPFVNFIPYLDAPGGNPVGGNFLYGPVSADTTLTSGTVYDVIGSIYVGQGAVLTVQENVALQFLENYELVIDGTFLVQGSPGNEVAFTGDWQGITINSTSTGSVIDYAAIEYAYRGISVDGTDVTISNSKIIGSSDAGIYMENGAGGVISGNTIDNLNRQNYGIYLSNSSPTITGNIIQNCDNGLCAYLQSNPVVNGGNVITSNKYGLYVYGNSTAGANPNPVVTGNGIYSNTTYDYYAYNFYDASNTVLDASNNWWGTTDEKTINSKINDFTDVPDYIFPIVSFVPFLETSGGSPLDISAEGYKDLQGVCGADTTLTITESPYLVVGQFVIPAGITLTIEPGIMIYFLDDESGLYTYGNLQIAGTDTEPVVLTSYSITPSPLDWKGITFYGTLNNGLIEYAIIEYADMGVYCYNESNPTIQNSKIRQCRYGINAKKQSGGDPQPTVNFSELYGNTYRNFSASTVSSPVTIDGTNNWWGSNDITTIQNSIRDYNDSSTLSLVNIDPYILKFSPNGDGTDETVTICYDFGATVDWTLTIKDELDNVVKAYQGTGSSICQDWDGTDTGGSPIGTGSYSYFLDSSGATYSSGIIKLDIQGPVNASVSITDPSYINYFDITLSLSANDAEETIISELSDFSDTAWGAYARLYTLTLSATEGQKTIYVKFRDQSNNQTAVITDTVVLDVTPPVLTVTYPEEGEIF